MLCGETSMIDWPERSGAVNVFWHAVGRGERDRDLERRTGARRAFQRNAAAHPLDDAVADAQPEAGAAIVAGDAVVGLLEFAKDPLLRLGRNADAGVADHETDFVGPDAGFDDQRDAAGRGKLDGVAGEVEQHLAQPRRVADHFDRQPLVDVGRDLDLARLRPRRQQLGDVLDHGRQRERAMFEVDLAGLDLGIVEQFLDQRQQRVARGLHRLDIGRLFRRQRRIHQQAAHADDTVQRRADFVARHREEARLGAAGRIGLVAGLGERALALGAIGDVAADALQFGRSAGVVAHQSFAPGDPARAERACDLLVVDAGAAGFERDVALFENDELDRVSDQRVTVRLRQFAIGVVGKGDAAVSVAQHDQVALGFEQAAGALLGFLQFPVPVGHRFVVQGDLAQLLAHHAEPEAQGRDREAGECEQEADADRECIGVVAGIFRAGAGDEAKRAAEGGGEDHEGADGESEPGMTAAEAANVQFDPERSTHRQ